MDSSAIDYLIKSVYGRWIRNSLISMPMLMREFEFGRPDPETGDYIAPHVGLGPICFAAAMGQMTQSDYLRIVRHLVGDSATVTDEFVRQDYACASAGVCISQIADAEIREIDAQFQEVPAQTIPIRFLDRLHFYEDVANAFLFGAAHAKASGCDAAPAPGMA